MKMSLKRLLHIVTMSLIAVSFTACPKRPNRPTPDQTITGLGPGDTIDYDATAGGSGNYYSGSTQTSTSSSGNQTGTYSDQVGTDGSFSGASTFADSSSSAYGSSGLEPRAAGFEGLNEIRGLLQPIFFEFDRSTIGSTERVKAQAVADYMSENPGARLLIEGHCDWRGTVEYNMGLGDRRANSIRDYLASIGVSSSRIETSSRGDLEAVRGGSDAEMAQDRRVEFIVLEN